MKNNFLESIRDLNSKMATDYISVNTGINPIYVKRNVFTGAQLLHVLKQYTFFSKNIVPFLLDANLVVKYYGLHALSDEIVLNVTEELGNHDEHSLNSKFNNVPHYVLLRRGFKESINYDIAEINLSKATDFFIKGIKKCINDIDPHFVAGSTYALESSATPELNMVYEYAKRYFEIIGASVPEPIAFYFESHINEIEIEHENRLKEVCCMYVNSEEETLKFESGFNSVLNVMDIWWNSLYEEMESLN